jgi:subtilase family serine protease
LPPVSTGVPPADAKAALAAARGVAGDVDTGFVRLPGHVLPVLAKAEDVSATTQSHAKSRMTLTLTLNRDDQAGFERYLRDVYDRGSPNYLHFLTQAQLAGRFGPSARGYAELSEYLRARGFRVARRSKNRLTLTVSASRATVERVLQVEIHDFRMGDSVFYASTLDPALPRALAARVMAINGLSSLAQPRPVIENWICGTNGGSAAVAKAQAPCKAQVKAALVGTKYILCNAIPALSSGVPNPYIKGGGIFFTILCDVLSLSTDLIKARSGNPNAVLIHSMVAANMKSGVGPQAIPDGTGQKIGLLEFDAFNQSDIVNYLALFNAPASLIDNLSVVPVNGGVASPGSGESEVLLDIDTVMTLAPGAKVAVYEAPFTGQAANYSTLLNAMINDGVTVISNSWASCEDQVSEADARSIDSVLQAAAASGISVFNGTGDSGSTCLDGSANTISVPADSPNATAVGGTSWPNGYGPGFTYGGETWWDGSAATPPTGQSGFGTSKYFSQPSYQKGIGSGSMRSVPDVVIRADPAEGVVICQADNGGCPNGSLNGGTSLAAPEWAAFAAVLNQSQGKNLGSFNALLYPLAATDAFHHASSMGSDFQHVGLGSPNVNVLDRLLSGQSVGVPVAANSLVTPLVQPGVIASSTTSAAIAADGVSQGGVLVTLYDANGNIVSGKTVTLTANSANAVITPASGVTTVSDGAVVFTVTDLTAEPLTFTATDTTDGLVLPTASLTFVVPPAANAGISANPSTVPADGQTPATIIVTLKDALNRPAPGKTVSIQDAGAHAAITGPTPAVTDANGQIQFTATDQVNETVTFTAIDVTDGNLAVPGSGVVTYSGNTSTACNLGTVAQGATGYSVTSYISGLPAAPTLFYGNANIGCPGVSGIVFTSAGTVLVSDFLTGGLYQTTLSGGTVSSANLLNTLTPALGNMVYGKDGSLYASLGNEGAEIVQINPTTGAIARVVASNLTCPAGLAIDPLSGDLFFDDQCTGGGTDDPSIYRIIDPANTNASNPTSVVVYATLPTTPNGGMAFAPNGTLYAVSGYYNNTTAPVEQISGTNSTTVTVTAVTGATSDYAVAIGVTNADGSAQSLIVEPSGTLEEVPIANPSAAVVLATGAPGVGVTGPDGCLYSGRYDSVDRLANSSGTCSFAPTSPAPSLKLTPGTVAPNPAQGTSQTFTASLRNVSSPAGVPVLFTVSGANGQIKLASTDANGNATLTYTAQQAGSDTVVATAASSGATPLSSNAAQVTWTAGKHVSSLTLNLSPQGGTVNQPVKVVASLLDISADPIAGVAGQTVTFTLGSTSCTATTNATGMASCSITPSQAGATALTASFAGNTQASSATASIVFNVSAGATPAPAVSITVSPTSIAAGSAATLTWSSTNATACTASGAWSGTESTSGTQSVTPATTGSYSYTLSCTGPGGSGSATAVLSATLVAVTVTAKSGGGAIGWTLLFFLGALVLGRLRTMRLGMLSVLLAVTAVGAARADSAAGAAPAVSDPFYIGIRVGGMPVRQYSDRIDQGLADRGFDGVTASTDNSGTAGTLFVGYEFTRHTAVELAYTYRNATAAHLSGTIPSSASLTPLLQNTTELIRGYGNILALSYAGRFEVLPRFSLEPRLGGFFWATKVSAVGSDDRIDTTHEGGGVTAGLTGAYRVWRGLELGVSVDHFRGNPSNIATLYAGTLEWRFGY